MPNVFIESYEEFVQRHGEPVEIDNTLFFPDGAMCGIGDGGFPRREPPEDEYGRLVIQRHYVREQLRRAEEDFEKIKSEFTERANLAIKYRNLPGPPTNAADILRDLRNGVLQWREQLESLETSIAATPRGQSARQREEEETERQSSIARNYSEFNAIHL